MAIRVFAEESDRASRPGWIKRSASRHSASPADPSKQSRLCGLTVDAKAQCSAWPTPCLAQPTRRPDESAPQCLAIDLHEGRARQLLWELERRGHLVAAEGTD